MSAGLGRSIATVAPGLPLFQGVILVLFNNRSFQYPAVFPGFLRFSGKKDFWKEAKAP